MRTLLLVALFCAAGRAVVLDRIAVTVGKDVITETEVDQEIRITALLNDDPLDFSPDARRQAAERLVDQDLIRRDMQLSKWPQPESSEAAKVLAELKRERFQGDAGYRQALVRYGVSETDLMQHLLWQLAALRYTDYRFRPGIPAPSSELQSQLEQATKERSAENAARNKNAASNKKDTANGRLHRGATQPRTDETGGAPHPQNPAAGRQDIDQQMDVWLQDARSRARIVYHEDAFR